MSTPFTLEAIRAAVASIGDPAFHFAVERADGAFTFVKLPPRLQAKAYGYPHGSVIVVTHSLGDALAAAGFAQGPADAVPVMGMPIYTVSRLDADRFLAQIMIDLYPLDKSALLMPDMERWP